MFKRQLGAQPMTLVSRVSLAPDLSLHSIRRDKLSRIRSHLLPELGLYQQIFYNHSHNQQGRLRRRQEWTPTPGKLEA
ncbi:hypothetical protein M758_3G152600, partial [Ceratodon purpureus]